MYVRSASSLRRRYRKGRRPAMGMGDVALPTLPGVFRASAEQWRGDLERAAPDIPTNFLVAWLDLESGGNPCSTGFVPPSGKDEAGIWQTMHPQDDRYGASYAELRSGCAATTPGQIGSGGQIIDASAINHSAQMAGLGMVRDYIDRASAQLAALGMAGAWHKGTTDFWKAVKSFHGLPCIMGDLLPRVVARFGMPSDWDDFREKAMQFSPAETGSCAGFASAPSKEGRRNRLEDIFGNASTVGKWGGGVLASLPVTGAALITVAAAGLLLVILWRRRRGS